MRRVLLVITVFSFLKSIKAQTNLVYNGGFETYTTCPTMYNTGSPDVISYALGWYSSNYNPDYYNACASQTTGVSVPKNNSGYQIPFDGQAYCGFAVYSNVSSGRESLSSQLSTPLIIGKKYFVSLRVNLIDAATYAAWGIDKLGVLFSTQKYDLSKPTPIKNYAQVYTNTIITDSVNWTLIKGTFVADSAFSYINVSNFFDLAHTDTSNCNPNANHTLVANGSAFSYYLVDDIRVSTDSLFGLGYVGVKELSDKNLEFRVSPNPNNGIVILEAISKDFNWENVEIEIMNTFGEEVQKEKLKDQKQEINLGGLQSGIYILQLIQRGKIIFCKKIVKE
jgi:hypothetical protein